MRYILYSTGCPQCTVLESKLAEAHIDVEKNSDVDLMLSKGMRTAPCLEDTVTGKIMNFVEAVKYIKLLEDPNV